METPSRRILMTAFEPSGDELGAAVAARLRELHPDVSICGLGGPRMAAAGVELIDNTTEHAVMLLPGISQVRLHLRRLRRLKQWLSEHDIAALVPIDSPGANWSICAAVRRARPEAKIIHLVAPQLWAWAPWRARRMRRLSDHALCLLPFEKPWFEQRGIAATFVGHPAAAPGYFPAPDEQIVAALPQGEVKLAILPGSRPKEIDRNAPTMLDAFTRLQARHPSLVATVAAFSDALAARLEPMIRQRDGDTIIPGTIAMRAARLPEVLHWCDLAVVTSGTATLHVALHQRPMVAMYRMSRLQWHVVGRWIVRTRTFTLPNLVAEMDGPRAIEELVPYFGGPAALTGALEPLVSRPAARCAQVEALARVTEKFQTADFRETATQKLIELAGL